MFGSGVTLASMLVKLNINVPEFQKDLDKAGSSVRKMGYELTSVGYRLSAAISAPLVAAGAASAKFSTDFTDTMTKTVTLARISESQMNAFRRSVLALGPAVGKGPRELAEGLYLIAGAGIRGANTLNVLADSAKASALGMGTVSNVSHLVTSAILAYGEANLTSKRATNALTATITEAAVESDALTSTLGRVLPIASQLGVTFEEVGASIATMTKSGLNAEAATTALRGLLNALAGPAKESKQILASIGLTTGDLVQKIKGQGLLETLSFLHDSFGGNFEAISKLIPNIRALTGYLATVSPAARGAYRDVLQFVKASETAGGGKGLLNQGFETVAQTPGFKFNQFKSAVETTAIKLGDQLAPALVKISEAFLPVLDRVQKLTESFSMLDQSTQTNILGLGAFVITMGPLLSILGNALVLFGNLSKIGSSLVGMLSSLTTAVVAFSGSEAVAGAASIAMALSWGQIAVVIGLVTAAVYTIKKAWDYFTSGHEEVDKALTNANAKMRESETLLDTFKKGLDFASTGVENLAGTLEDKLSAALGRVQSDLRITTALLDVMKKTPSDVAPQRTEEITGGLRAKYTEAYNSLLSLHPDDPMRETWMKGLRSGIEKSIIQEESRSGNLGTRTMQDLDKVPISDLLKSLPEGSYKRPFGSAQKFDNADTQRELKILQQYVDSVELRKQNLDKSIEAAKKDALNAKMLAEGSDAQTTAGLDIKDPNFKRRKYAEYFGTGVLQGDTANLNPEFKTALDNYQREMTLAAREGKLPGIKETDTLRRQKSLTESFRRQAAGLGAGIDSPLIKELESNISTFSNRLQGLGDAKDEVNRSDKFAPEHQTAEGLKQQLETSVRLNDPLEKRLELVQEIGQAEIANIDRQMSKGAYDERVANAQRANEKLRADISKEYFQQELDTSKAQGMFADAQQEHLAAIRTDLENNGGTYAEILDIAKQQDSVQMQQMQHQAALIEQTLKYADVLALTPSTVAELNAEYYKLELAMQRGPDHARALNKEFINIGETLNGLAGDAVTGIASGTLQLGDAGKQIGQAFMANMIKSTFEQKRFFDFKMKANLLDYLPGVGKDGGEATGSNFVGGMLSKIPVLGRLFSGGTNTSALPSGALQYTSAPVTTMYQGQVITIPSDAISTSGSFGTVGGPGSSENQFLTDLAMHQYSGDTGAVNFSNAPTTSGTGMGGGGLLQGAGYLKSLYSAGQGFQTGGFSGAINAGLGLGGTAGAAALAAGSSVAFTGGGAAIATGGGYGISLASSAGLGSLASGGVGVGAATGGSLAPIAGAEMAGGASAAGASAGAGIGAAGAAGILAVLVLAIMGTIAAFKKQKALLGAGGYSSAQIGRASDRAAFSVLKLGKEFEVMSSYFAGSHTLGGMAATKAFGGGRGGAGVELGASIGNILGPAGSLILAGIFKATKVGQLKATETLVSKKLAKAFDQLGIERVTPDSSKYKINTRDRVLPAGYESVGGNAAGVLFGSKFHTGLGYGKYSPGMVRNAILNNAAALNLSAEDAQLQVDKFIKGFAGDNQESAIQNLLKANDLARKSNSGGLTAAYRSSYQEQLDTIGEILRVFNELPRSIDATAIATSTWLDDGSLGLNRLKREIEDIQSAVIPGIEGIFSAMVDMNLGGDPGLEIASQFGETFKKRVLADITDKAFASELTQSSLKFTQAADALVSGDTTKYEMLKKEGLDLLQTGTDKTIDFLSKITPEVQSTLEQLGLYTGPRGIVNQTNFGSANFGNLNGAGGSSDSASQATGQSRSSRIVVQSEVVFSTRDQDRASFVNSRNRLTSARFPKPYVSLVRQ